MFGMFHAHTFHLPILLTCTADNKTIVLNFWREKLEVCAQFPLCVIPLPRYCPQHTLIVPSAFVCVCMPCRELGRSTTKLLQTGRLIKPKDMEKNYKRLPLCKWHITLGSWLRDAVCCSNTLIKVSWSFLWYRKKSVLMKFWFLRLIFKFTWYKWYWLWCSAIACWILFPQTLPLHFISPRCIVSSR